VNSLLVLGETTAALSSSELFISNSQVYTGITYETGPDVMTRESVQNPLEIRSCRVASTLKLFCDG